MYQKVSIFFIKKDIVASKKVVFWPFWWKTAKKQVKGGHIEVCLKRRLNLPKKVDLAALQSETATTSVIRIKHTIADFMQCFI